MSIQVIIVSLSIFFIILKVSSAFNEQECVSVSNKWDLDCEFDDELEIPAVLHRVDEIFAKRTEYRINITICDENSYYADDNENLNEYILEEDYLWELR